MIRDWGIDLIVPIPLHWRRKRKRGYNQAEIIAKNLEKLTGLPVDTRLIVRKKYTEPQKALDHKKRKKNLRGVFEVKRNLSHKRILLIDDIYTTGSTIDEAAKVLLGKGHNKVWFLTISIGQDF